MTTAHRPDRRLFLAMAGATALFPARLWAAPRAYRLLPDQSRVGFNFFVGGGKQSGTMPVRSADIVVDPNRLAASQVAVELDVTRARTGIFLATQAMTGPEVLDAKRFPTIRFRSTRIRLAQDGRLSGGAQIDGELTIRDVTRPVSLAANLYRTAGSAPEDLDQLSIRLTGTVSRKAFGASGHADLVEDRVELDVQAVIHVTD
ncbi:MAG: YceI family protein [Rhodobacteraceae bacterium]|nr:YceI family protein [Paracoccaceae bacterium]